MTNQNKAAQAVEPQTVLSFDERERILCQFIGEPINHDREMAIAIETTVLSKQRALARAPVAREVTALPDEAYAALQYVEGALAAIANCHVVVGDVIERIGTIAAAARRARAALTRLQSVAHYFDVAPEASLADSPVAREAQPPETNMPAVCDLLDKIKKSHAYWGGWSSIPSVCDEAIGLLRSCGTDVGPQASAEAAVARLNSAPATGEAQPVARSKERFVTLLSLVRALQNAGVRVSGSAAKGWKVELPESAAPQKGSPVAELPAPAASTEQVTGHDRMLRAAATQEAKDGIGALDALYDLAVKHGANKTAASGFAHVASGAFATLEGQVHDEIRRRSLFSLASAPAPSKGC